MELVIYNRLEYKILSVPGPNMQDIHAACEKCYIILEAAADY